MVCTGVQSCKYNNRVAGEGSLQYGGRKKEDIGGQKALYSTRIVSESESTMESTMERHPKTILVRQFRRQLRS